MVKQSQKGAAQNIQGKDHDKKKTDLPPRCEVVAGTGSALDHWRMRGEAEQAGSVSVVVCNHPPLRHQ